MTTRSLRTEPQKCLYSHDLLRGFGIFRITGGAALSIAIAEFTGIEWLQILKHHVEWEGFQFFDLIFPLFMFIAGVAIPFFGKIKNQKKFNTCSCKKPTRTKDHFA